MARQLPFDVFVVRKIQKWETRAKDWGVDFIDAIGVSPIEEMIYFWNGYKRMAEGELNDSLAALAWSEGKDNPNWHREALDEHAILALLRAAVLRNLRRHSDAQRLLKEEILSYDKAAFKGNLRDDWTPPTAHYEMAVNLWMERDGYRRQHGIEAPQPGTVQQMQVSEAVHGGNDAQKVKECGEWIEKAAGWESYELDARIGLKITTAKDTLKKWNERYGNP